MPDQSLNETFPPIVDQAWFLSGPTASGKSAVAVCLAERIDAEILSLDSMTVYRGMDVGTAKPSSEEQQRVRHHLLDLVCPDTEFSVSEYLRAAHQALADVTARGKKALFVGGTPLYMKGCLRGFDVGPPADWEFRQEIEQEIAEHGIEALRARLKQVDPIAAHQLHPNDQRRMIRALEVARSTGQPLSHRQIQFDDHRSAESVNVYALHWDRALLHRRIEQRVDRMFADGLVDEVQGLSNQYDSLSRTARQAVGYKEVLDLLDGKSNLDDTIEHVKAHSRQLARRQETWLRSLEEVRFVEKNDDRTPEDVADEIVQRARDNGNL